MLSKALSAAGGTLAPSDALAMAELAGGSVGEAFRLTNQDGLSVYAGLIRLMATLPRMDRAVALKLDDATFGQRRHLPRG